MDPFVDKVVFVSKHGYDYYIENFEKRAKIYQNIAFFDWAQHCRNMRLKRESMIRFSWLVAPTL